MFAGCEATVARPGASASRRGPRGAAVACAIAVTAAAGSARAQPVETASYDIDATLDAAHHAVRATGVIAWTNRSATPATSLWLHLYLNAFRDQRSVFMRSRATHAAVAHPGRIDLRELRLESGEDLLAGSVGDPLYPDDATQLRVALPRPVAPGETVRLRARWDATLPEVIARTGYSGDFHMVAQWFPKVAVRERDGRWATFPFHANSEFYSDFGRYDVRVTVPRGWVVGATGVASAPVARGSVTVHRFAIEGVHDFAFTAWPRFVEHASRVGHVSLRVLHPPGDGAAAERVSRVLSAAMPAFARRFGPYPYPVLTAVIPPRGADEAGGMEYPTLITVDAEPYSPAGRALSLTRFTEYVTVHEFGHQYFYGLLASDEHRHPFLDEGLCEWATGRVMADLYGPSAPLYATRGLVPGVGVWAQEGHASGGVRAPLPVDLGAGEFPTWGSYATHVYARTTAVLRTAERLAGEARGPRRCAPTPTPRASRTRRPTTSTARCARTSTRASSTASCDPPSRPRGPSTSASPSPTAGASATGGWAAWWCSGKAPSSSPPRWSSKTPAAAGAASPGTAPRPRSPSPTRATLPCAWCGSTPTAASRSTPTAPTTSAPSSPRATPRR
ncbi:MAG: hypothetical protein R3A52_05845 [Polyangiales bacterium]